MKVIIAKNAGICPGVKNSYLKALSTPDYEKTYILGQLAHNRALIDKLAGLGIKSISDISEAKATGYLIIRSHGVSPLIEEEANMSGFLIFDATCSFVKKTQLMALRLKSLNKEVCIIGEKKHPEVLGLVAYASNESVVIESDEDISDLRQGLNYCALIQSTFSLNKAKDLIRAAQSRGCTIELMNTCCPVTLNRQIEAEKLAKASDVVIVIGDTNSSNTHRLFEIAGLHNEKVYWIESAKELQADWFDDTIIVSVIAGASTPEWIVEEVIFRMEELFGSDVEVTSGQLDEVENATSVNTDVDEELIHESMNLISDSLKDFKTGDFVTGKIVQVNEDCVLVDIGYKSEGKIPSREFAGNETACVGDDVLVCIKKLENREGELILSKRDADLEKRWQELNEWFENKIELTGKVVGKVKGGLLVDIGGIKGFLPASLADRRFVSDLDVFNGKDLAVEIIEINRRRNKIVLSAKDIAQRKYETARAEAWDKLKEGIIARGVVKRLVDFGAFVELDGVEGLLHVSELSWKRVKHPSEILSEGQEIEVKVLSVDSETGRISLSMKQVVGHPWEKVRENYEVGNIVKGTVISIVPFGAFVRIADGVEGLVHISQLSDNFTNKPADVVSIGQEVDVKILEIDSDKKRISLSIKEALPVQSGDSQKDEFVSENIPNEME